MFSPKRIPPHLNEGIMSSFIFLPQLLENDKGGSKCSCPFPMWGEKAQLESLAPCFCFHKVDVNHSALHMEGKLLLHLICDTAWAAIGIIGELLLCATQLWMISQSPPFKLQHGSVPEIRHSDPNASHFLFGINLVFSLCWHFTSGSKIKKKC